MSKYRTTLGVEPEQVVALRELAARRRVSITQLVREGIDLVLRRHEQQLNQPCAGCGASDGTFREDGWNRCRACGFPGK